MESKLLSSGCRAFHYSFLFPPFRFFLSFTVWVPGRRVCRFFVAVGEEGVVLFVWHFRSRFGFRDSRFLGEFTGRRGFADHASGLEDRSTGGCPVLSANAAGMRLRLALQ